MMTSPQFRESPDVAKYQVWEESAPCAGAAIRARSAITEIPSLCIFSPEACVIPLKNTWDTGRDNNRQLCNFPIFQESPTPCPDRKSTRLNSSHLVISYAVFCLKQN